MLISYKNGGKGGVRTHGTLARSPVLKTGAFDHSACFTDFVEPYITRLNYWITI